MGDVKCINCGEPWDAYELRHCNTRKQLESEGYEFGASVLVVKRCPCCPSDKSVLMTPEEKTRLAMKEEAAFLLGDDEDGLQSILEDLDEEY